VNRGLVSREVVEAINDRMVDEVERRGGRITDVAYCPHRPDESCSCRKPEPGLLVDLAWAHGVDLSESVLIGDALTDIQAGRAAGCHTMLVLTGRGRAQLPLLPEDERDELTVAADLEEAVSLLLSRSASVAPRR
jgi:D-glycero-D-manno-heptose 1,7-bisphosphate phosphatase